MLFYLTVLNLAKFLIEKEPKSSKNESGSTTMVTMDAWNHIDFICENYILNGLKSTLHDVYSSIKSAKVQRKALNKKY